MKKFVFIPVFLLLGMSIVTVTSCSKDEGESNKIENSEPTIPIPTYEMSGKYEGKWNDNDMETGNIEVYEDYIIIDELPTKAILTSIINEVRRNPESESYMVESIGNFFSASNYNFPRTNLVIRHQLESYSDGYYIFSVKSVKNIWSSISTIIDTDYEAPYPAKRIEIGPSDPLTISFGVEADGVPYRIDLISIEHEMDAKFNLSTERVDRRGLWTFLYWYNTYRFINLNTGQQRDITVKCDGWPRRRNKEDTNLLKFEATKWKGPSENQIITL